MNSTNRRNSILLIPRVRSIIKSRTLICGIIFSSLLFLLFLYSEMRSESSIFSNPLKYQWKPEYNELNGPDISERDPRVLEKLRNRYLFPPSHGHSYNLSLSGGDEPSMGQSQIIRKIFGALKKDNDNYRKRKRFFIECGALDGETRSNTLYLERNLNWDGLLIEADPTNFIQVTEKKRKAWTSNTCLSTKNYPTMVNFEQKNNQGKISSYGVGYMQNGFVDVQCFPLNTFLDVLNITEVDYLSLDVEGNELDILRTIDWDRFKILTLSVEFIHDQEGKSVIRNFMENLEYTMLTEVTEQNWLANDFIFVRNSLFNYLPPNFKSDFSSSNFKVFDVINEDKDLSREDLVYEVKAKVKRPLNSIFSNNISVVSTNPKTIDDFDLNNDNTL